MGSQESKPEQPQFQEEASKEISNNGSVPSSPIFTPLDPRSPSENIARTPLEQLILEDKADESAEEDGVEGNTNLQKIALEIDPRSPTLEFVRTPIIVETKVKEKNTKPRNKNLDKVRQAGIPTTPVTAKISSNQIPPKLLSSSPVSHMSYKRKSIVGLLETNVDFTETNLDMVPQAKTDFNQSLPLDVETETDLIPVNKLKTQMESLKVEDDAFHVNKEEEKSVNITAHVKDFDKKLMNLIYEDESDEAKHTETKTIKFKENSRTPLGSRNANESHKRGAHRLRVSDKPRKSEISRIPVLKDAHGKVGIQCENTPPSQMYGGKMKSKISHWDADKTLII